MINGDQEIIFVASGAVDALAATAAVCAGGMRLVMFSITEDAGAAARVRLRHGTDATGTELFDVRLAASESTREYPGQYGPWLTSGLFLEHVAGTYRATLYFRRA
jgi:hypothetical protein